MYCNTLTVTDIVYGDIIFIEEWILLYLDLDLRFASHLTGFFCEAASVAGDGRGSTELTFAEGL